MPIDIAPIKLNYECDDGYLENVPERFAKWLAAELKSSHSFRQVKYVQWNELAKSPKSADIIVSGEFKKFHMVYHEFSFMALPPQSCLVILGILPVPTYEQSFTLKIRIFPSDDPENILWSEEYNVQDPEGRWRWIWGMKNIQYDDNFYIQQRNLVKNIYGEVNKTLSEEVIPGFLKKKP